MNITKQWDGIRKVKNRKVILKYGCKEFLINLPKRAKILQTKEPESVIDKESFDKKLIACIESSQIRRKNIAVVVADKTRLCSYPKYLPVLLNRLQKLEPASITIFIAYGTHEKQTESQCIESYGESYLKYRFIHHDCHDKSRFILLGKTKRGTEVFLPKDIIKADSLITFGPVSHHYFAGYGGGRKLIFPGLGFKDSINHNHSLILDRNKRIISPFCRAGNIDKNRIALDLEDIERLRPADLAINGVLNSSGNVSDLIVGPARESFLKGVRHLKIMENNKTDKYDLVIGSCGGYPKDINFIQSHKSVHNAAQFVKSGKRLIIFAKCEQGIGSETFLSRFESSFSRVFSKLADKYEGNGGTALSMMLKSSRINILIVTDLDRASVEKIGMKKISVEEVQSIAENFSGSTAAIPQASLLVRV